MKKYLLVILSLVILLCSCNASDIASSSSESSYVSQSASATGKPALLVVNGQSIENNNVSIYENNQATVPLIPTLTALGFECEWINDTVADITKNGTQYTLNLAEKSFAKNGKSTNYISGDMDDESYKCLVVEKDVILDDITLYTLLTGIGENILLSVDNDALTVTVSYVG